MTVKEKLSYFSQRGVSISYIARELNLDPTTLTKWLRGEKGITHKNEERVLRALQELSQDFVNIANY